MGAGLRKTKLGNVAHREKRAGIHVPYAALLDDSTVITKDGMLLQIIKIGGYRFETADFATLEQRKNVFNTLLKSRATAEFAVWTHLIRRREYEYPAGTFPEGFAKELDERWREKFQTDEPHVNELYLTVVRKPGRGKAHNIIHFLRSLSHRVDQKERRAHRRRARRELDEVVRDFLSIFEHYSPRRLGAVTVNGRECSEPLSFLSYLINGRARLVSPPHQELALFLPDSRLSFGGWTVESHGNSEDEMRFGALLSIKEYVDRTRPGMLDDLLSVPADLVVTQSFVFMERQEALSLLAMQKRKMLRSEDPAQSLIEELDEAMDDVASGRVVYGEHHATVLALAQSEDELLEVVPQITRVMNESGNIAVREDVNLEAAYFAQLPGNMTYVGRRAPISSRNFASFASFHNYPTGKRTENHWGDALTVIETTSGAAYYFNYHANDIGNACVFGKTGTGKTTFINFTLAQSLKYGGRRIYFDKDRGAEIFVRAVGGNYSVITPGTPTGFNPLRLPDTEVNRQFLHLWICLLARREGSTELSPEDEEVLTTAVDRAFSKLDKEARTLTNLLPFLGNNVPGSIRQAIEKWTKKAPYGWVFDNEEDTVSMDAPVVGFDMTHVLDEPSLRTAITAYLFHLVEQALDGSRVIIVLEEFWKLIADPIFEKKIEDWKRTNRKRNAFVICSSQSLSEAIQTPIARIIFNQSPTRLFFPDPDASQKVYCDELGLSERQWQLVKTLPAESRVFLLVHASESLVGKLNLESARDLVPVLSAREETARLCERLRETHGDNPSLWLPHFYSEVTSYDI